MTRPSRALTHGGKFHADDVFSAALLRLLFPKLPILRRCAVPADFDGLVFDIGGGTFDHHQTGASVRDNGVPYAAFGLLWREYGARLVGEEEAARFDRKVVQPLDQADNTGCAHPLADAIDAFNPVWDSAENADEAFEEAVTLAGRILERQIAVSRGMQRARAEVSAALARMQDGVVILERYAPWKATLIDSPAKFVVYPSQRGGYSAQVVPLTSETPQAKCPFPAAWAGQPEEALPGISGVPTLRFCHNARFLISADTLADAVMACRAAQAAYEE